MLDNFILVVTTETYAKCIVIMMIDLVMTALLSAAYYRSMCLLSITAGVPTVYFRPECIPVELNRTVD